MDEETIKKLRRRIVDYLFKYASLAQIVTIAKILGIKEN
jgi:hypothetical protein